MAAKQPLLAGRATEVDDAPAVIPVEDRGLDDILNARNRLPPDHFNLVLADVPQAIEIADPGHDRVADQISELIEQREMHLIVVGISDRIQPVPQLLQLQSTKRLPGSQHRGHRRTGQDVRRVDGEGLEDMGPCAKLRPFDHDQTSAVRLHRIGILIDIREVPRIDRPHDRPERARSSIEILEFQLRRGAAVILADEREHVAGYRHAGRARSG